MATLGAAVLVAVVAMRTATLGRALGRVKERRRSRHRSHARTARAAAASEQTPSQASGVARRATSRARRRWRAAEAGVAAAVRQARVDPNRPTVSHSRQRRSKLSDFGLRSVVPRSSRALLEPSSVCAVHRRSRGTAHPVYHHAKLPQVVELLYCTLLTSALRRREASRVCQSCVLVLRVFGVFVVRQSRQCQ